MDFVVVSTTVDSARRAGVIARRIVAKRLAACVQQMPIRSIYWWKGRMETASEHLLLAKTRAALAPAVVALIRGIHPYELPEITVTPITGGLAPYLAWIKAETDGCKLVRKARRSRPRKGKKR